VNNFEDKLVQFLSSKEDPVSIQTILKGMGLPKSDKSMVRSQLRDFCRKGRIVKKGTKYWVADGQQVTKSLKQQKHSSIRGRLSITSKGFGFVQPSQDIDLGDGRDWFISDMDLNGARHGDTVLVDWKGSNRGRVQGRVSKILEFGTKYLVGSFTEEFTRMIFQPFNQNEAGIPVLQKFASKIVPGTVAIYERQSNGEWTFQKAIGSLDDPSIDEEIVCGERGIPLVFPDKVLEEAQRIDEERKDSASERESFVHLNVFTVDGADARDFDDAIHIIQSETGFELGVHIADVSNYVTHHSLCDRHAGYLGNSTYLPHKAFPMLPRILSENLCSLNPDVERLTCSVIMQLDPEGNLLDYRVTKGRIISKRRLTYEQVYKMGVEKDEAVREEFSDVIEDIDLCLNLAGILREQRFEVGGLDIQTVEPRMTLNDDHMMEKVWGQSSNRSHQMIEMFMCLANQAVATYLAAKGVIFPYRIHERPEEQKILQFIESLSASGIRIPRDMNLNSGHFLNRVLDEIKVRSSAEKLPVWRTLLLRSLKRAHYSVENQGHFGLGLNYYCHFTSPIRRYADLVVHQVLTSLLAQEKPPKQVKEALSETCEHLSLRERDSAKAEHAFFRIKMLRHLAPEVGKEFDGVITDAKRYGLFIQLNDLFVDGLVSIEKLDDDYRLRGYALVGERKRKVYQVGDPVKVQIERIELTTRSLDLGFMGITGRVGRKTNDQNRSSRRSKIKTSAESGSYRKKRKRRKR